MRLDILPDAAGTRRYRSRTRLSPQLSSFLYSRRLVRFLSSTENQSALTNVCIHFSSPGQEQRRASFVALATLCLDFPLVSTEPPLRISG